MRQCLRMLCSAKDLSTNIPNSSVAHRSIAARKLARVALQELQSEMNRDYLDDSQSKNESSSTPPLAPDGWSVQHPRGSNALLLGSKIEIGSDQKHARDPVVVRSIYVSILSHFQSKDPSLYDPTLDTCEYIPFVARVQRPEKQKEMWIRFAYVNSTLRTIGISFVPTIPYKKESGDKSSSGNPMDVLKKKEPIFRKLAWEPDTALSTMVSLWEDIKNDAYPGPQFREGSLSTEFKKCLEEYTTCVLGINGNVGEFIAQACYFYEQKEYERWLGKVSHFVDAGDLSKKVEDL